MTQLADVVCEPSGLMPSADLEHLEARCQVMVESVVGRPVSVLLCDDAQIHNLNAKWRDEDKPTDVLSFVFDEADAPPILGMDAVGEDALPLGDVVISVETAGRQAAEHGWDVASELAFLFAHGLCHLLGHDHFEAVEAQEMAASERSLLALCGLERPTGLAF